MEKNPVETSSFTPKLPLEHRGAGGKFRKPPSRRPPSTPYARPPQNLAQRGAGGWLSKLVNPAYRLISGGANLIFPSFFSKSESVNALPTTLTGGVENDRGETDNLQTEGEQEQNAGGGDANDVVFEHVGNRATGAAEIAGTSTTHFEINGDEQNQKIEVSDLNGISKIEQLMKAQRFSRDEINRLIGILNSRGGDLPDVGQENRYSSTIAGDNRGNLQILEYSGKLTKAKQEDLNRANWGASKVEERKSSGAFLVDVGNPASALEISRKSIEEKREDLDRVLWNSSTPLPQAKFDKFANRQLQDGIGTSPIDIARAYMENRTSEIGFSTNSLMSKDEGTLPRGDEPAQKSYIPSAAPKSSPCWPGASLQDQHGYATPQSRRERFGLHNFPRTPYSRSIYTKSNSRLIQLQSNGDRHPSMISTPFQQIQAPTFGQINSRANTVNDGHGSVGPIRRIRHKVTGETPRASTYFHTPNGGPMENFSISEGLFSTNRMHLENGGTSRSAKFQSIGSKTQSFKVSVLGSKPQTSEVSVPTVPAHSSLVAKKILEHLERNPPTPKDKSAELRLATSWKKSQSSDIVTSMPKNLDTLTHLGGPESTEKSISVQKNNSLESAAKVNVAVYKNTSPSDMKVGTSSAFGDYSKPSQDFRKPLDSQFMNAPKDVSKVSSNAAGSEVLSFQKLPPQNSSTRPMLPSITINKPNHRWNFSSDNGLGFTFPISTAPGGLSEPPTPSILPSSLVGQSEQSEGLSSQLQKNEGPSNQLQQNEESSQPPQNEGSSIPSYSFGSSRSTPALVFSVPSTSSTCTVDDAPDLKFKFGSDDTARISFSSVGKDAICY